MTVYNIIDVFIEKKLINPLRFVNSTELHLDYDKKEHYHFHCKICGKIYDVKLSLPYEDYINHSEHEVENFSGSFTGVCRKCLKD